MDDFQQLELLSLVAKIHSELQNHLSDVDEDTRCILVDYLIEQRLASTSTNEFRSKLHESAGLSASLTESIDRLILGLHPRYKIPDETRRAEEERPVESKAGILEVKSDSVASKSHEQRKRPFTEIDDVPKLYKIYNGYITALKDFGAFVKLHDVRSCPNGLVHVSAIMTRQRVGRPSDLLSKHQEIKVKVISVDNERIGLSIKDVDQFSGIDLATQGTRRGGVIINAQGTDARVGYFGIPKQKAPHMRKRPMTEADRWDALQFIKAGVGRTSDLPELEEDYQAALGGDTSKMDLEEEIEIEVRHDEARFLEGQTGKSLDLSPIRVVRNPTGSLAQAAGQSAQSASERRELHAAIEVEAGGAPGEAAKNATFVPIRKQAIAPRDHVSEKRTYMSVKQQRESLPVFSLRNALIKAVKDNQFLVVVGETGSGKTTQLTQYLVESGFASRGVIGCTQPRRVAAKFMAQRLSDETGTQLGYLVGYHVRFEPNFGPDTQILYQTDGMLRREILADSDLLQYSVVMLDKAHERTITTDILFAFLKKTTKQRSDLKIIITSATLNAKKFSNFFNECPIFTIPGRTFPVELLYSKEPELDYFDVTLLTVIQIHITEEPGDILVFLTGSEEIDSACSILSDRMNALGSSVPQLILLPIYSALPSEQQSQISNPAPPGCRKVVIATNIAETSITIDHIRYVVDPGFVKQNTFDPKLGMHALIVTPISQAQANQCSGRAGRTAPGKCFRLYTEAAPRQKQEQADQKNAKFHDPSSDHITLLNVYTSWERSGCSKAWCFENFVQARSIGRAKDIRMQLEQIFRSYRIPIVSCGKEVDLIKKALCAGFFRSSARRRDGCYKTLVKEVEVFLHPSSALFGKQAEWIIYNTLILTTREYCHVSTAIHPQWLADAAPTFFKVGEPLNKRKIAERIQPLHDKYASSQDDWRLSAQRKKGRSGGVGGGTWG
ncbi:MAG: hypothetical protein Q9160_002448 [Pyrenula sp. 1 TL-2023]